MYFAKVRNFGIAEKVSLESCEHPEKSTSVIVKSVLHSFHTNESVTCVVIIVVTKVKDNWDVDTCNK